MAAGSIPCVTKLCPHLTVDFRTPGNFTARPETSCLVALRTAFWCLALPGLCHCVALPGLCQRGLGRGLDGSGTWRPLGRFQIRFATEIEKPGITPDHLFAVQLGGGHPPKLRSATQSFARSLPENFARSLPGDFRVTPVRAWVLNYVRRELWSGQVIVAPTL